MKENSFYAIILNKGNSEYSHKLFTEWGLNPFYKLQYIGKEDNGYKFIVIKDNFEKEHDIRIIEDDKIKLFLLEIQYDNTKILTNYEYAEDAEEVKNILNKAYDTFDILHYSVCPSLKLNKSYIITYTYKLKTEFHGIFNT